MAELDVVETEITAPVVENDGASDAVAEPVEAQAPEAAEDTPQVQSEEKPRKDPVAQLQGRVGHLTKVVHQKDEALAEAQRQVEAMRQLLGRAAPASEGAPAETQVAPQSSGVFTAEDVQREAARIAAQREFDAKCNDAYQAGKTQFPDFDDTIRTLQAMGIANRPLVEAALETGEAAAVLNHLGQDLDEAARIAALPPTRMAVKLTKLATKLSAPAPARSGLSGAPPPIRPVTGTAKPEIDVYDPNLDMADYARARAKQGAKWARVPTQSH